MVLRGHGAVVRELFELLEKRLAEDEVKFIEVS
jgi:hypothetical protein